MCGKIAYCWNTMPRLRRQGGTVLTSFPSMSTRPESGFASPAMMRSVDDLPEPLGPRKVKNSPLSISRQSSSATTVRSKRLETRSNSRMGVSTIVLRRNSCWSSAKG